MPVYSALALASLQTHGNCFSVLQCHKLGDIFERCNPVGRANSMGLMCDILGRATTMTSTASGIQFHAGSSWVKDVGDILSPGEGPTMAGPRVLLPWTPAGRALQCRWSSTFRVRLFQAARKGLHFSSRWRPTHCQREDLAFPGIGESSTCKAGLFPSSQWWMAANGQSEGLNSSAIKATLWPE